jgi:anti-sigma factor RsiW
MYEGPNGKRLTVLVAQNIGHRVADPKLSTRDDLKAMTWTEGPLMVAVTSDLGSDRLRGIGEIVSTSLKGKG